MKTPPQGHALCGTKQIPALAGFRILSFVLFLSIFSAAKADPPGRAEAGNGDGRTVSPPSQPEGDVDIDGVSDSKDAYPYDKRRWEDIPVLNYAVLDISGSVQADNNIDQVAMGQDGRMAFSFWDGNSYKVGKWINGAMVANSPKSMANEVIVGAGRSGTITKESLFLRALNANGDVGGYGEISWNEPYEYYWVLALWPYGSQQSQDRHPGAALHTAFFYYNSYGFPVLLENGTFIGLTESSVHSATANWKGIGKATLAGTGFELLAPSAPGANENYPDYAYTPLAVSRSGRVTATRQAYSGDSSLNVAALDATGTVVAELASTGSYYGDCTIPVINDAGDFVFTGAADGKPLYYSGNQSTGKLEDLLPEKYKKQIILGNGAIALANNGKLFSSIFNLEGNDQGQWVGHYFISDKTSADPENYSRDLKIARFPENWTYSFVGGPQGFNENGLIATKAKKIKDDQGKAIPPENQRSHAVMLLPVEVVDLAPQIMDEDGHAIANSEKPSKGLPLTPFVEVNPAQDRIAHRELKVKIGSGELSGKKVTWSMVPVPNSTPAKFRGVWQDSQTHPDRFETSATYGAYQFRRVSQQQGETQIDAHGFTAIRVNVPPIAYNKPRIRIQIEGSPSFVDLIDMEVPAVVVIDPGHGGNPSGPKVGGSDPDHAICPLPPNGSGSSERIMTLEFGMLLRDRLRTLRIQDRLNLRIYMTRTADVNSALAARANIARDQGADILISFHFNDNVPNTGPRGTETYSDSTGNFNQSEDQELAGRVNDAVFGAIAANDAGAKNRGVKGQGLDVLSDPSLGNSQNYHPTRAVLLEMEFIDVPAVDQLLNTNASHEKVRQDITDALGDALQFDLLHNPQ